MATTIAADIRTVNVQIPVSDYKFFKTLSKKMGWGTKTMKSKQVKKSELDLSLESIKQGDVVSFSNVDDALAYLNRK